MRPRAVGLLLAPLLLGGLLALLLIPSEGDGTAEVERIRARTTTGEDEPPPTRRGSDGRDPKGPADSPATGGGAGAAEESPSVAGIVVDEEDRGISGAEVALHVVDPYALRGAPIPDPPAFALARTERDGAFRLAAPPEGWMRVVARAEGRAPDAAVVGARGAFVRLRLVAGGALNISVLDESGRGIEWARVLARVGEVQAYAVADATGVARFEALPPGPGSASAETATLGPSISEPFRIAAGGATEVVLLLGPSVLVQGTVLDAEDGVPVPGARVDIVRRGHTEAAGTTDAEGRFPPTRAGASGSEIWVAVRADGRAPVLSPHRLGAPGGTDEVEVLLERASPWRGRVEDEAGRGVAGALVTYTSDGILGREPPAVRTAADGLFEIPPPAPPAPGRRVVLTAKSGRSEGALALRPGDAQPEPLVLVLSPGATVTGRIEDAEGRPVTGAVATLVPDLGDREERRRPDARVSRLLALNEGRFAGLTTSTDAAGRWTVEGVPAGEYSLRLEVGGTARWVPGTMAVERGTVDAGVHRLGGGFAVSGEVSGPEGPLGGTVVHLLRSPDRRSVSTTADGSGSYRFEEVPAGTWQVSADAWGHARASRTVEVSEDLSVDLVLEGWATLEAEVTIHGQPYQDGVLLVSLTHAGLRRPVERTVSVAEGRASLGAVDGSSWDLVARTPTGLTGSASGVAVSPGRTTTVRLELRTGGSVRGRVLRASGEPAAGARVDLRGPASATRRATAGADGAFRVEGLPSGDWEARATSAAGTPATARFHLAAGGEATPVLALGAGGSLEVSVVDEEGRAVPRAQVFVAGGGRAPFGPVAADASGRLGLDGLASGVATVRARAPDGAATGRARVEIAEGRRAEVVVTLRRAAR